MRDRGPRTSPPARGPDAVPMNTEGEMTRVTHVGAGRPDGALEAGPAPVPWNVIRPVTCRVTPRPLSPTEHKKPAHRWEN
jgi:hypothetical protein